MRLLVAGGRYLDDVALIRKSLDRVHMRHDLSVLIHGGHAILGVTAEDWARERALHVVRYPANWRVHGKRAEGIRNEFMLADGRPDLLLALPGGEDTRTLVLVARARGLPVIDHRGQPIDQAGDIAAPPDPDPDPEPDPEPEPGRAAWRSRRPVAGQLSAH